jgi:hypothetical protein
MKRRLCMLLLIITSFSCKRGETTQPQPTPAKAFQVHLQSGFSDTPVTVSVDQTLVFADTVTTGFALAVAAIIPVEVNQGSHNLRVAIANILSKDTSFTISDSLYVGVSYDSARATINYRFQRNPFYYR